MQVTKFAKLSKNKYKVVLEKEELILFEDVILKYNLLYAKNISLEILNKILEDNSFYEIYERALNYIDIKMRSEFELTEYLKKKEYDASIIEKVVARLKKESILNDKNYVKAFINDKISFSLNGPHKIKRELLNFNIEDEVIDEYLNEIDEEIWHEKINKIIEKKAKINKKLSSNLLKQKISSDLYILGYEKDMFMDYIESLNVDEFNAVNLEYKKAYQKYKSKYNQEKLDRVIRDYLIKKGFSYESINETIANKNEN